jgi:hypothetical protein
LTSGTTPGQNQQESESSTSLPSWYTNYTQQILNSAAQYAATPYQTYQGPRIAGQSALTNDAYGEAAPLSSSSTAGTQAASNLINQGTGQVNQSVAPGQGGLAAAQPYLNSASTPTYDTVQNYMNPYNSNVTNAIAQEGATNFNNNVMPALNSSFISAGNITGGNTEEANLANQAALNEQQAVSQAQSGALQSGYAGSQTAATNAANLQGQLGSTAGQLGTQQQTAEQNAGTDIINAGGALQGVNTAGTASNISAINAQNTLGQQNQGYTQANENLAYQDFLNQKNQPLTAASAMQGALSGIQVPTTTTNYGASNGTPATISNSPLVTAAGALSGLSASTTPVSSYDTSIPTS